MSLINKLFRKRDWIVVLVGLAVMQILLCLVIDRFMFYPVNGGYTEKLCGYMNIGTHEMPIAARIMGPQRGKKVILYCHGNAEDITAIDARFHELAEQGYTIATFDYPGYGLSGGSANEKGCYENAHKMYDWLVSTCRFAPKDIFVVGYSIGTGVAIELSTVREVAGLWLEAPYLSAPRIVTRVRLLAIDPFPNINKIRNVKCPVIMIHGTDDSIIPYSHGRKLFDAANEPKRFITVDKGDHADFIEVMGLDKYQLMLLDFLGDEKD